jgi:hypothetical protein
MAMSPVASRGGVLACVVSQSTIIATGFQLVWAAANLGRFVIPAGDDTRECPDKLIQCRIRILWITSKLDTFRLDGSIIASLYILGSPTRAANPCHLDSLWRPFPI